MIISRLQVRTVLGGTYQSELLPIIGAKSTTDYYNALQVP